MQVSSLVLEAQAHAEHVLQARLSCSTPWLTKYERSSPTLRLYTSILRMAILKRGHSTVVGSLIAQILQLNPLCLNYLYQMAIDSCMCCPTGIESYKSIFESILTTSNPLFIGIDGLDECEKDERHAILSLLEYIEQLCGPKANLKIFLTSQRLKDVKETDTWKNAIRIDLKRDHVKQDIQDYIYIRSLQLCARFGYSREKQKSIAKEVSDRPQGNTRQG